jgi:hypothetical protein
MTKGDFETDHLARKVARYLLVIEFLSLFIALILVAFHAAPIAFLLAILTLVIFISVFVWLYFRFRAFPIVQEKAGLQRKADDLHSKIRVEGNKINEANQRRSQLTQVEEEETAQALESFQKAYIQYGLANTRLDSAKIPGVGPKLKERLALHRIVTAADINSGVHSIQGFGGAKSQALLSWQRNIYDELIRTKPVVLPMKTANTIRQKFQMLHEENNVAEATAKKSKQAYEANLRSIKPRLEELAPINFTAYLTKMLAPQKWLSFLLLFLLVLVQCILGSSTGMASIAASLPTMTFTPTQTYTPTSTFTPTIQMRLRLQTPQRSHLLQQLHLHLRSLIHRPLQLRLRPPYHRILWVACPRIRLGKPHWLWELLMATRLMYGSTIRFFESVTLGSIPRSAMKYSITRQRHTINSLCSTKL